MHSKKYPLFIASIVSIGGFLFGFDAAVISGIINYITAEFLLSNLQVGWVGSCVALSSAVAMLSAGALSNRFGRKKILIGVAILYTISAAFSALAPSYTVLWIARLIGGLAFGAALVLIPVYIAETVPARYRGAMVAINQLAIVIGFSAAFFCNYYLKYLSQQDISIVTSLGIDTHVWRWMLGVECLPAFTYLILLILVPNSPRWLIMNGRHDEANLILKRIYSEKKSIQVFKQIIESLGTVKEKLFLKESLSSLFSKSIKPVLILGIIVGISQMATGFNAVLFYATNIFERTGIGTDAAFTQSIWLGIINVAFTVVAIILIDRVGRRPLLLTGLAGMAIFLCVVSYGFDKTTYVLTEESIQGLREDIDRDKLAEFMNVNYDSDVAFTQAIEKSFGRSEAALVKGDIIQAASNLNAVLLLIGILGVVSCFAFSLGPVMWVLLSEIFPNSVRAVAISLVGGINSLTSWIVVQFFPWQLDTFGISKTFIIYAGFAFIAFIILFKLLPETKGRSLEELEAQLISDD